VKVGAICGLRCGCIATVATEMLAENNLYWYRIKVTSLCGRPPMGTNSSWQCQLFNYERDECDAVLEARYLVYNPVLDVLS
jgi:hypothetical protein